MEIKAEHMEETACNSMKSFDLEDEEEPLLPVVANKEKSTQSLFRVFNDMEYWPVWLGFMWYIVVLLSDIAWNVSPPTISEWRDASSFGSWFTDAGHVYGFVVLIAATLFSVFLVHRAQGKPNDGNVPVWSYIMIMGIVVLCKFIGSYAPLRSAGFGESVWCIIIGWFIRFFIPNVQKQIKKMLSLEFFIKVAIVLLAIDMSEIVSIGLRGLSVAWLETTLLVITVYYIGVKILKMDPDESLITSSGLSICGSSAVMAISDAISLDTSIAMTIITIMSILTVPLIPALPAIARALGLSDVITGVWIGGCVDSTGAVAATAALGGMNVLHTAIILKMLQNILIGPVTLVVTAVWIRSYHPRTLWLKFPKFVLGFLTVAIVTSFLPSSLQTNIVRNSFTVSEWFSAMSFVLIGLETNLGQFARELFGSRKSMLILYCIGQALDVFTTIGFALLFFRVIK